MATTELYRYFSASGQLLYVGISGNAIRRLTSHKKKRWGDEITRLDIEKFPDRDSAMVAEQRAIISEMPIHNVRGSTDEYPASTGVTIHPEMLRLRRYLKSMKFAQRTEFAERCGTKVSYLNVVVSGGKKVSVRLAVRLAKESSGEFSAQRLFPELGFKDHSQVPVSSSAAL